MSIWEAFGMGRYKGFSREAGLLLDEAVELAGSMGCARADTGHLLLAMLQTDRGPAGRFLAVAYTHLRAHETVLDLVCRLLLEKKTPSRTPHVR